MKNTLLVLLLSLVLQATGQKKTSIKVYGIELDTIATMVQKHPKYFDHLIKKSKDINSNFKQSELIMMYYGSTFLKNYTPKKEAKAESEVAKQMGELDFAGAIKKGKQYLQVYPVSARLYMLIGYAYKKIGEKQLSKKYYKRYADIIRIPLYSNSGESFDKAFIVRSTSDEFLILNYLDKELVQQEVRYHQQLPHDVLFITDKLHKNKRLKTLPKEKLYFNIYLPLFIGEGHSFKELQDEAKRKFKVKETPKYVKKQK